MDKSSENLGIICWYWQINWLKNSYITANLTNFYFIAYLFELKGIWKDILVPSDVDFLEYENSIKQSIFSNAKIHEKE